MYETRDHTSTHYEPIRRPSLGRGCRRLRCSSIRSRRRCWWRRLPLRRVGVIPMLLLYANPDPVPALNVEPSIGVGAAKLVF